jgi:hypothetical protein
MRFLELTPQTSIEIEEGTDLENEAGACVWDAAISLIYFLVLNKGMMIMFLRVSMQNNSCITYITITRTLITPSLQV